MDKVLVSVIIPLYNAENYIEQNINKLLNQTFKDFEIIIVNDGSSDNSYNIILEKFKKEIACKKIKCFTQENFGAPSARNRGMSVAVGDYYIFLDADDYYYDDAIEKLYNTAKNNNADLVISSIKIIDENDRIIKEHAWFNQDDLFNLKRPEFYSYSEIPLGKIYNANIIKKYNIKWDNLRARQDTCFYYKFLCCTTHDKVFTINEDLSCYRVLPNSISHKKNLNLLDLVKSYDKINEFCNKNSLNENLKYLMIPKIYAFTGSLANGIKHYKDRHYRRFISYYFMLNIKKIEIKKDDYDSKTYSILKGLIMKAYIKYYFSDFYYLFNMIKENIMVRQ